ncbi:hypothetical protein SprV_0301166200 [Sparganum proliferum]
MPELECLERFTHLVRQLHNGIMVRVKDNGTDSEECAVTKSLKQASVPPTLFSLMFYATLMNASHEESPGINIIYGVDDQLLNIRRMKTSTQTSTSTVHELLSTDGCALKVTTESAMRARMCLFASGRANFGMAIKTD